MATAVSLTKEAEGKAVKTTTIKICPLLNQPYMKENCEWFVLTIKACAIQTIDSALELILKDMLEK